MSTARTGSPTGPLLIGLTGGIGSGKTTVANLFAARGVALVDTDLIAHALTGPGGAAMPAIAKAFGDSVLAPDGRLDRAAMRALVFADPDARARLEAILHPMIRAQAATELEQAQGLYAMLVVPLMVESGAWLERLDRLLVVDCPTEVQIDRVMKRSALSREQVLAIMATQASREVRLQAADDTIDNRDTPDALPDQVDALHAVYSALATIRQNSVAAPGQGRVST
jgi:dephospho-CoA kinase